MKRQFRMKILSSSLTSMPEEPKIDIQNISVTDEGNDHLITYNQYNSIVPILEEKVYKEKMMLAVPFAHILKKLALNSEAGIIKVPIFPKHKFGCHMEKLAVEPKFHILTKDDEEDLEKIRKLKLEGGRLKKNYSSILPKLKIKSKYKNKNLQRKSALTKFWYAPDKHIRRYS
ncbi:hypothetical protein SteCoe_2620 [Stentor coeruleus]|uniref:Uncharacterized protein n=1 Tax=Stentor coeruleus TaxID=5963 RepID=A0A1R2CZ52_9CILI|nr:hypothetical protein SteCoe_2620 [Stentor coeruleus]